MCIDFHIGKLRYGNLLKVRASAVLVPEFSDLQSATDKYLFSYSIRMALLREGCIINGLTFPSCQLHQRHWIIRASDVVSHVDGDGVIGKVHVSSFMTV